MNRYPAVRQLVFNPRRVMADLPITLDGNLNACESAEITGSNIVVKAHIEDGLIANVAAYEVSGVTLPPRVLSNSNGTKVILVRDVEPNRATS